MAYSLPDLPYDYGALEPHYSGRILELHYGKHHRAYVEGANQTLEKLAAARSGGDFDAINALEKNLAFHVSGHVLHTLFWNNMTPGGGGEPEGELAAAIEHDFGGFEGFRGQLSAATVQVQGSGWGALAWEPLGGRLVVQQVYDHQGSLTNASIPLLVIDAWEHAYYLQFENRRADWVDSFWRTVNWPDVAERFARARGVALP